MTCWFYLDPHGVERFLVDDIGGPLKAALINSVPKYQETVDELAHYLARQRNLTIRKARFVRVAAEDETYDSSSPADGKPS